MTPWGARCLARAAPPRRVAAAGLAVLVLACHLGLLWRTPAAPGPQGAAAGGPRAAAAVQVRQISPAQARREPLTTDPTPAMAPTGRAAAPAPTQAGAATLAMAVASDPLPQSDPLPAGSAGGTRPDPPLNPLAGEESPGVPVYATDPAPPVTLHYQLQRGARSGTARLQWQPDSAGYTLNLAVEGGELAGLGAASRGAFDPAGLAPDRFVDRRRGRDVRSANFRRELGSVTFSATAQDASLQRGMQDRLSWILQLPAVLQADAALASEGAEVSMWVAGARGRADVWTFRVVGAVMLALPGGGAALPTLHLRRAAAQPYDTQVDVWLDPARHHLPVRIRLASPPGEWTNDMQLTELDWAVR